VRGLYFILAAFGFLSLTLPHARIVAPEVVVMEIETYLLIFLTPLVFFGFGMVISKLDAIITVLHEIKNALPRDEDL